MSLLRGIRVADFSRVLSGPLCTMVMGDLGADVIKIERPEFGDDTRSWGPPFAGDDAAYYLSLNRNKRSIVLDLRSVDGISAAMELVRHADVLVENFRPHFMEEIGLGYNEVSTLNPGIVYASIPAFSDPNDDRPGYDLAIQALSGLLSITGPEDGTPVKVGVAVTDVMAGLYTALGVIAALMWRKESGRGEHVTVSLFDSAVAGLVNQAANYLVGGLVPRPMGSAHPNIVPYQLFLAADSKPFVVAVGNDRQFRSLCTAIDEPELSSDSRFENNSARIENRIVLVEILQRAFSRRSVEDWVEVLTESRVPCAPMRSIADVFRSPEGSALIDEVERAPGEFISLVRNPLRFRATVLTPPIAPPRLGEHTREILEEIAASHSGGE